MFNFFKKKKKSTKLNIDEQVEVKEITENDESTFEENFTFDIELPEENVNEFNSDNDIKRSNVELKEHTFTMEELNKIIIREILRVIENDRDFNSIQVAAEEATKVIGKENIEILSTYLKDKVSKPSYMKGRHDELGQWPRAVENSVLSIIYAFKEDGVDELLKIVANGGSSSLKSINLLCKLAAKGIEREKIVDSLIYIMKSLSEEDKHKVLGYLSQIKGHGKIERLYQLYYKKFIVENNLENAYDIVLDLINIRGRYTREQLIFIKALALYDGKLDMDVILKGENGIVNFAKISEELRIKAAISFYSLNKSDDEINDKLYYLKNNSLDSELREFLAETLE